MILLSYNRCIIASIAFASVSQFMSDLHWDKSVGPSYPPVLFFFICPKNMVSKCHSLGEVTVRSEGRTEVSNTPATGNYFADSGTNYSVSLGATVQHRIGPFHRAGEKDQHHIMGMTWRRLFWCKKIDL